MQNIPYKILASKILQETPELNISETELAKIIWEIHENYHPFEKPYNTIHYHVPYDEHIAKDAKCKFCGGIGMNYFGYKKVNYPYTYLGYLQCKICGHAERL